MACTTCTATLEAPRSAGVVQIFLRKGELLRARGALALQVVAGRLWITRKGDAADTFVSEGEDVMLPRGDALFEAEFDTAFKVRSANAGQLRGIA